MNIHLPAILGFTRYQGFDPSPSGFCMFLHFLEGHEAAVAALLQDRGFEFWPWVSGRSWKMRQLNGTTWDSK